MSNFCNHCGTMLSEDEKFCPNCGAKAESKSEVVNETATVVNNTQTVSSQSNINNNVNQAKPQKTNGLAIASMVCGIVGLFIGALWLGITALCLSIAAKNRLKVFPEEKGKGMATAGLVLGIIDIAFGIIAIFASVFVASLF